VLDRVLLLRVSVASLLLLLLLVPLGSKLLLLLLLSGDLAWLSSANMTHAKFCTSLAP
jgi:hypothetical protein